MPRSPESRKQAALHGNLERILESDAYWDKVLAEREKADDAAKQQGTDWYEDKYNQMEAEGPSQPQAGTRSMRKPQLG
jgi:hypothetical protein